MQCPACNSEMEKGYIYVRGLATALFWAKEKDIKLWSRKGLKQIHLQKSNSIQSNNQTVIEAGSCSQCERICFKPVYI